MLHGQNLDLSEFETLEDDDNDGDIYNQLARKERYLMLAAEAGNTLLERNRGLEDALNKLNVETTQKIEDLEMANYNLKKQFLQKETHYHAKLQDLIVDKKELLNKIQQIERKSKICNSYSSNNFQDVLLQNEELKDRLEMANLKNNEFSLQVQTLKRRIEARSNTAMNNYAEDFSLMEFKMANEQVKKLQDEKRDLLATLDDWAAEKISFIEEAERTNDKMSLLEQRNKYLEQQISIARSDLDASKVSNTQLKEQLEEYILQASTSGFKASNSLMSELEKSLLHDNDNSHVDEIMDDPNNFVPVSISSPKKPSEHPNQIGNNNLESANALNTSSMNCFERQIYELNQKLNESYKSSERITTKYNLTTNRLRFAENKIDEMQQQLNSMGREVELYKRERELVFREASLEDALLMSLEDRRKAFEQRNEALEQLEQTKSDMAKLNSQLLKAVQQKLELEEQLELWQVDMAALIDRQLKNSSRNESKRHSKSKLFTGRWSWTSVMKTA